MILLLCMGLLGALLMFAGDMLLYYDKDDYDADGTLVPIINIMKRKKRTRLYVGALIGLLATFFYSVGYYHTVLFVVNKQYMIIGWICFLINVMGIIFGGAYHTHCANLGLLGRYEIQEIMDEVQKLLAVMNKVAFGIIGVGFMIQAGMILCGITLFPRWMIFATPIFLVLLTPLMRKLPKGWHMIICGGWTNLISVIYYGVAILVLVF